MKFIFTTVMVSSAMGLMAQQFKVQGVERNGYMSPASVNEEVAVNISFDDIAYWVGEGENSSALVVKWDDNTDKKTLLVWGYKWSTPEEGTGIAMMEAIAKADPRFYMLTYSGTQFGTTVGGMGYDLDNDNDIALVYKDTEYKPTDGIVNISDYSFDDYMAKDTDDHWNSGWYNGYWSYWTAESTDGVYGYASVGCSSRKLVDGSVDGWSFMADMSNWNSNDMSGEVEYVKDPQATEEPVVVDYTTGRFILNEGWFGHENSTLNYLTKDGEWVYRAFQKENPGMEIGATSQFATFYGDKLFIVAKQSKDPGASVGGGRLTVCDAKTLKCLKQFENISTDGNGSSNADGRGFLGVNENKAYIGSSNGIYIFDIANLEIKGKLTGTENEGGSGYENLYGGQIGTMVRVNENVYAVHQKMGIMVIDAEADTVKTVIAGPDSWGYGSVVLSKDGNLWASVSASSGSGQAAPFIMKINPETCDTVRVNMPEGIYPPANSWYAWTPDCFCASTQQNVLYWNGGESSWFSGKMIFKYDIDSNSFTKFLDFSTDPDNWQIYGCSFRVDPVTDNSFVSLYHQFSDPTFVTREYDNQGNLVKEYSMISNYWFPSIPVFPDNELPVVAGLESVKVDSAEPFTISLASVATDADNMQAAIVKTVKNISDRDVVDAVIRGGNLDIIPQGKNGQADITIGINSNGKLAEAIVSVYVEEATSVDETESYRSIYFYDGMITANGYENYDFVLYNVAGQKIMNFTADSDIYSVSVSLKSGAYILKGTDGQHNVSFKFISK